MLTTLSRRLSSPVPYWRWVRLPADRRVDATIAELGSLIRDHYARAKQRMAAGKPPGTFLDSLAEAAHDGDEQLAERDVISAVLNMIVAGEDNTAATASWAMHYLATHPEAQRLVRAEAAEVFGDDPYPAEPSVVAQLTYAEAVVQEAIRLRLATPFLIMEATEDTIVGDDSIKLSLNRGSLVMPLLAYGSDSDERRYPDAGEFEPRRWLSKPVEQPKDAAPFLPFGAGPRFCPGRNLALLESMMVVSMACHNFVIEADTSAGPVGERLTFALFPTNLGIRLRPVTPQES